MLKNHYKNILFGCSLISLITIGCQSPSTSSDQSNTSAPSSTSKVKDVHSQANFNDVVTKHLDLDIKVDIDNKQVSGIANWTIDNLTETSELILDTDDLQIDSVILDNNQKTTFELKTPQPHLGAALHINVLPTTKKVSVYYSTIYSETDTFAALQWLAPSQTFGKQSPFMFTKSEPTMTRCWIPSQDAPSVKVTYNATVRTPAGLLALMSANNPTQKNDSNIYHFNMPQAVPAYLIAMVVGDLSFQAIDNRTGVYAEPPMIAKSAAEFTELPAMLTQAEALCGPYDWDRYDVIVLPSGFPIGGMENPRLTFLTPTVVAGDKSLVSLLAHELAHSWSGNLITNATWNDLWINEGFTVYFERRIMEAIRGKDYADMLWTLGKQDLDYTIQKLGDKNELTKLKLNLEGISPLESFSDIAYEKGAFFLWNIEQVVGREKFDAFVREYFKTYRFQSISTEDFITYMEKNLLQHNAAWRDNIQYIDWIYNPGIPNNCPIPGNTYFSQVDSMRMNYEKTKDLSSLHTAQWSTHEWLHFIRNLSTAVTAKEMKVLDKQYQLTSSKNSEIACAWYTKAIKENYSEAYPAMEQFLFVTGRQKFLEPLYEGMITNPNTRSMAMRIFNKSKNNYHPIAQNNIQGILNHQKN